MSPLVEVQLCVAAALGGVLNALAGGGSFVTFPALLLSGVAPIPANATSTVALWPGSVASVGAYRRGFASQKGVLVSLVAVSLVGGVLGALVLLRTPQATFMKLVPYLFLAATLLYAVGPKLRPGKRQGSPSLWALLGGLLVQFLIAAYGGFFGGGIGILMLALLVLLDMGDLHAMNAVRTLLTVCINGVAVVTFALAGAILWRYALPMMVAAVVGGYGGARFAQTLPAHLVRRLVLGMGFGLSAYFLWRG